MILSFSQFQWRACAQEAGFYTTRDKAAYWDGKNESGEKVSSGVYFYTIQAGEFAATKKMSIAD